MKDLITRALTGIVFVAVLIGAIVWNKYSVAILFGIISILGLNEFFRLMEKAGFQPKKRYAISAGAMIYGIIVMYSFNVFNFGYLLFIYPLLIFLVVLELFRKSNEPVTNFAFSIVGILYVVIPFAVLNFFAYNDHFPSTMGGETKKYNYILLLAFFIIQWANDTGAYLFGSLLGKNKLLERISPNKTIEGAIGGILLGITAGVIFAYVTKSPYFHWIAVAFIITTFGTLGDLTESQIKRSCGVKDSGNILPGHGGVLDRFDGVLFSAPFVLAYLQMFNLPQLFPYLFN